MCTCLKYSLFWAPVQCLLVPDWTAFCPGCSKQSWLNTFRLAAFGVPPCVAQDAGQIWLQHVWSSLDTMWWATAEFPKHCCHLWQARCFYLFIHGLFTQQISLGLLQALSRTQKQTRTYRSVVFWVRRNPDTYQAHPHLIFLLRKLRPREMKCSTTSGLSASYCPSWREGLLLKCGGAGPKFHVGPSGAGMA